jgi:hypothetical protein
MLTVISREFSPSALETAILCVPPILIGGISEGVHGVPSTATSMSPGLISGFARNFKAHNWLAGCRLPEFKYDCRSLASAEEPVSSHAKCIVIDGREIFISSASFTEAASAGISKSACWSSPPR